MNLFRHSALILFYSCLLVQHVTAAKKDSTFAAFVVASPVTYTYLGDSIHYELSLQLNPAAFTTRTRLVIEPEIRFSNPAKKDTLTLAPIVLEGKLYHNLRLRNGNIDKYDSLAVLFTSKEKQQYTFSGCFPSHRKTEIEHTYIKSFTTSCCEQRNAPLLSLKPIIQDYGGDHILLPPFDKEIRNIDEQISENIKWRKVSGHVYLLFEINEHKIDLKRGDNADQIERMTEAFRKVVTDPYARFDSASIKGQASPDGSLEFNTKLANRRSLDALSFLKTELDSLKLPYVQRQFRTSYIPEAWDELYKNIENSLSMPDKEKVLSIIRNTPNVAERKYLLKRMKTPFAFLRDSILGKIRRVDYEFYFTFKDLSPDEQQELLYKRPDVYVPADFLSVEKATQDDKRKLEILHIAYRQYPANTHLLQNLLAEYIRQQMWQEAETLTDTIDAVGHARLESGFVRNYVIVCVQNESYQKLYNLGIDVLSDDNFTNEESRKELQYGLGLMYLKQYCFEAAYQYLEPFQDRNTVLALRGLGRKEEADMLEKELTN